jgi:predicted amidohydrolase
MTHGNSMVIDPWGEILARMDKGEGVVVAELDRKNWSTPGPACRRTA